MPAAPKPVKKDEQPHTKVVADNRRARHEYEILETFEAGLAFRALKLRLCGRERLIYKKVLPELKTMKYGLYRCHISPYDFGNRFNHDPLRKRRLLMHRRQINKLKAQTQEKGLALIPLKLIF